MAPETKVKKVKKPAVAGDKKVRKHKRLINKDLGSGIMLYSRKRMNANRRKHLFMKAATTKKPAVKKPKVAITVVKKIGGSKNGGERVVLIKKPRAYYPTKDAIKKRPARSYFSQHKRNTKKNMKPGRVLVLLAGRHAGKRVVLLKVLGSGLLLVNGPFGLNGCPLRRVNQRYAMGTKTRLALGHYHVPKHINDKYFKRQTKKKSRGEGDIFAAKKEDYVVSDQRKKDQVEADKVVMDVIKKHPDRHIMTKYLKSMFGLKTSQYPHRMKF